MSKLSVVIPAYNELATLPEIIQKVKNVSLPAVEKEIIVVDDGSTDGTKQVLLNLKDITCLRHEKNCGKGEAIRTGFKASSGDIVLIQDADLEYAPEDYPTLLKPILEGEADVVFGSRFVGSNPHRVLNFHHFLANRLLTFLSNLFTNLNLSDIEAGYKVFSRKALESIGPKLKSKRFGIEVELVARAAKAGLRVFEVGISYSGRTYAEGKKINWKDGLAALWHIVRFNLFD